MQIDNQSVTYGYARVSRKEQSIERQIRNILREYPEAKIYEESYTGTTLDRPKFQKLLKRVKPGDKIVFDSVSRMSRNKEEGFRLYEELFKKDVELVFLKEPHINTVVYKGAVSKELVMTGTSVDYILEGINKYMLELAKEQIRLAFEQSEKEVVDLRQRTKEGMETAKLNGKQIGRKSGSKVVSKKSIQAKEIILKHSKYFGGSLSDDEVMKLAGVNRSSFYKYKKELKEES